MSADHNTPQGPGDAAEEVEARDAQARRTLDMAGQIVSLTAQLAEARRLLAEAEAEAERNLNAVVEARAEVARLTARLASAESECDRHRDREDEDGDRRGLRHLLVARPGPLLDAACDEIESLRAEVARLRALIDGAPHHDDCPANPANCPARRLHNLTPPPACTCWKARAEAARASQGQGQEGQS